MLKQATVILVSLLLTVVAEAGVIVVRAHFDANENFDDMVGIRYKLRIDENFFETTGKIIFNGSHFYNPDYHLSGYYTAIETNFYNYLTKLPDSYLDMGCATSGGHGRPAGASTVAGLGSVIVGIVDWWREYPDLHGRVGLKSTGQTIYPTFGMTVDSIDGLTKSTAESQVNMTGKDVQLELLRGETFTSPLDGWGAHWLIDFADGGQYCEDNLQPDTLYRKWYLTLTIDGVAYRFEVAVFEEVGRYLFDNNPVGLLTEFFELDGYFRAYYWDFEVLREGGGNWIPLNTFEMTEHIFDPLPNRDYGPKFAIHDERYVLEISNDHTGSINEAGSYFQLGDVFAFPDPSTIDTLPTIDWNQPAVNAIESQGSVSLVANLDVPAPAEVMVAVSMREAGKPIVHDLMKIPAGELAGTLTYTLNNDTVKQPNRQIEVVFDSSASALFGSLRRAVINVIDDDITNDAPTAPIITAIPGLSCTTLSPRWTAAMDESGPVVSYNVYRQTASGEYLLVRQVDGGETRTVDRVPEPGSYSYAVSAVDVFGMEGAKSQPVSSFTPACSSDTVPPTGGITTPLDGSTIGGLVVIEMDVADDDPLGVNSVDLYRDNSIYLDTIFLNLDQSFLLDTTKLTQGLHSFFIRAYDFGGNAHQSSPAFVMVNNGVPSAPMGLSASLVDGSAIELHWGNPPPSEVGLVNHYEVLRDGNLIGSSIQPYYLDSTDTSKGLHCYAVVARSYADISSEMSQGACTDTSLVIGDIDGDGDVDIEDLSIILSARNTPANGLDDQRDLDGDGVITVLDARKLVLLCTRPRCASD